jgi:hypothetical protein
MAAVTAVPATKPDPNSRIDDVHFRLDELERKFARIEALFTPEKLLDMIHTEVLKYLRDLPQQEGNGPLMSAMLHLLKRPSKRVAIAHLPSGPVRMEIIDSREGETNGDRKD